MIPLPRRHPLNQELQTMTIPPKVSRQANIYSHRKL